MSDITMIVETESGAVYQFRDGYVRRISDAPMRDKGEWVRLLDKAYPVLGQPMLLILEGLDPGAMLTQRITTPVFNIEVVSGDDAR